eukprot:2248679-Prymnesium_polylepis.1
MGGRLPHRLHAHAAGDRAAQIVEPRGDVRMAILAIPDSKLSCPDRDRGQRSGRVDKMDVDCCVFRVISVTS